MQFISSSKVLTKLFFNVDILPYPHPNCQNWDITTPILKKALDKYASDDQKILEVGTGQLGILSIYLKKKKNIHMTAIDINPIFIENAKKNAQKNNVSIHFIQSDLFSNVNGLFDIVFFNPPYVSKEWILRNRKHLYSDSIFDLVWNGGVDGFDTIERFLKNVPKVLYNESIVLLGVNTYFINPQKIKKFIQKNNLELVTIISYFWTPSKIFVFRKKE